MNWRLRFTDKYALFYAVAHMIGGTWREGMQYPFTRELKERWQIEIGNELTEDGYQELVSYENAMIAIETGDI